MAAVGSAGGVLLTKTADVSGLSSALRDGLGQWRKPAAVHDPGKVLTDLALTLALGGEFLSDAALVRSEPERGRRRPPEVYHPPLFRGG